MDVSTFWLGFSSGIMVVSVVLLIGLFAGQAWEDWRRQRTALTLLPGPIPEQQPSLPPARKW